MTSAAINSAERHECRMEYLFGFVPYHYLTGILPPFSTWACCLCKCALIKNQDPQNAENDSPPQDSATNEDSQWPHDFSGRDQDQVLEKGVRGEANYCILIGKKNIFLQAKHCGMCIILVFVARKDYKCKVKYANSLNTKS